MITIFIQNARHRNARAGLHQRAVRRHREGAADTRDDRRHPDARERERPGRGRERAHGVLPVPRGGHRSGRRRVPGAARALLRGARLLPAQDRKRALLRRDGDQCGGDAGPAQRGCHT